VALVSPVRLAAPTLPKPLAFSKSRIACGNALIPLLILLAAFAPIGAVEVCHEVDAGARRSDRADTGLRSIGHRQVCRQAVASTCA
jgi:hypothetical protein